MVAHELGHAKDRDVVTGTLIGALGAAAAVIALYLLGSWGGAAARWPASTRSPQPRAFPLLLAVVTVVGLVAAPVQALVSRRIEARADAHALALTGDPATFEAMQRRLSTVNLATRTRPAGSTSTRPRTRPPWSGWPPRRA